MQKKVEKVNKSVLSSRNSWAGLEVVLESGVDSDFVDDIGSKRQPLPPVVTEDDSHSSERNVGLVLESAELVVRR